MRKINKKYANSTIQRSLKIVRNTRKKDVFEFRLELRFFLSFKFSNIYKEEH
jgi:hypothetical protein